ncbi:MAG: hypothetical protein ACJAY7_001172 [Pseudohongiellaceae bacterium]
MGHGNEDVTVMVKPDNFDEYLVLVLSDLTCHSDSQVTAFEKSGVLQIQRWVGGEKQANNSSPAQIPEAVRDCI